MPKSTALAKKQPKPFVRRRKPVKVKLEQQVQMFVIQRKDGADIMLPLDSNENRKLMQIEAAKFNGTIDQYERLLDKQGRLAEMTPLQLKQLGEAKEIAQKLSFAAWDKPEGEKDPKGGDDVNDLLSQVGKMALDMRKKEEEIQKKSNPIEVDAEDVKDG